MRQRPQFPGMASGGGSAGLPASLRGVVDLGALAAKPTQPAPPPGGASAGDGAGGGTAVGGSKIKSRRSKLRCTAPIRSFFSQGLDITASTPRSKASTSVKSANPLTKITIGV